MRAQVVLTASLIGDDALFAVGVAAVEFARARELLRETKTNGTAIRVRHIAQRDSPSARWTGERS